MKEWAVLCALAGLLLAGCGNTAGQTTDKASGPIPGQDAQNQYMLTTAISFQETDRFFCGSNFTGNYLHYYDKASGISGVLCADPACTHDSTDCGAYMQSGASLSYYDGKLYWIAKDAQSGNDYFLWRSDLSGTSREKVKRLGYENVIMTYQPQQYAIHRGKLYMLGQASSVEGIQTGCRVSLLSAPLDSDQEFTTIYEETFDRGVQAAVRFVGNAAYLSVISFPEGGPFDVTVMQYNINTETTETVYEETGMTEAPGMIWVTEQGEIYLPGAGEDHAYVWQLESGKRVEVVSWEGVNLPVPKIMDGIATNIYLDGGIRWIDITDLSGGTIYSGQLFPEEIPGLEGDPNEYGFAVVGGDADKIILNLQSFTGNGLVDDTLMLDLNDDLKATILWSSQE